MDFGSISIDSHYWYSKENEYVDPRTDELTIGDTLYFGLERGFSYFTRPWIGTRRKEEVIGSIRYKPIVHPKLSFDHKTLELAQFGIECKKDFGLSYRYWLPETEKCCIDDHIHKEKEHLFTAGMSVNRDREKPFLFYFKLTPNWRATADERKIKDYEKDDSGLGRCTFKVQGSGYSCKFGISAKQKPMTEEEAREFAQVNQPQFKDDLQELIDGLMDDIKRHTIP